MCDVAMGMHYIKMQGLVHKVRMLKKLYNQQSCYSCMHAKLYTVYLLIYRTLLITPDTLLGNFRCSNTMDTPVLQYYICSKYPDNTLKSRVYIHRRQIRLRVLQLDSFE